MERAVREVFASGRPIAQVAEDLGIHREALRKQVRQAEADRAPKASRVLPADVDAELKQLRRENAELRRANEILTSASIFFAGELDPPAKAMSAYIDQHKERFGVEPICRTLGIAPSSYYARRVRPPSARQMRDGELVKEIHAARDGYRRVYGIRKTWRELSRRGVEAGRDRVGRLMRAEGLEGVRRGRRPRTTVPGTSVHRRPDLVERDFAAAAPNQLWVADFTYLRYWEGVVFFSFVIDVFSRRIVGWQLAPHMRTDLVLDALRMALGGRRGDPRITLIHHSDAGSQGGFNRSSQHLECGGGDGTAGGVDEGVDGQIAVEVAGGSGASAGGRARVLACDREGAARRGGGGRGRCVRGRRQPVVSPGWSDANH